MKAASIAQMRAIDALTINEFYIPGAVLMENAGRALAECAVSRAAGGSFLVLCGKGNNGGDGSVAARHLFNMGKKVTLMLIANPQQLAGDALANFNAAQKTGMEIKIGLDINSFSGCDVIIDALLGLGGSGAPQGQIRDAIDAVNASDKIVLSADVPSGLNADTGIAEGACVKADITVTFGLIKPGLALLPGAQYAGRVLVRDISFSQKAVARQRISTFVTQCAPIPTRRQNSHKGTYGKVFALCGSEKYTGAAYLSSLAALKSGCGVVSLAVPRCIHGIMAQKLTEVITIALKDGGGILSKTCIPDIDKHAQGCSALLCGCGLGRGRNIENIVSHIIQNFEMPIILDADGINAAAANKSVFKRKKADLIITPHIGEMANLTGLSISQVQGDIIGVAKSFASEYDIITVLKGATTVVALPNGEAHINTGGNSGMSTAGSGDVLAGIAASFVAQGMPPGQAAVSAVFVHSCAGGAAVQKLGAHGMLAGDILAEIPNILKEKDGACLEKHQQNMV